jgi:hypothetical protein
VPRGRDRANHGSGEARSTRNQQPAGFRSDEGFDIGHWRQPKGQNRTPAREKKKDAIVDVLLAEQAGFITSRSLFPWHDET